MLIELAVGDAYGAGFEYAPESPERPNDLSRYVKHPRHAIVPGCYTDDTQMSIAIAELIVSGAEWTPINIASQFVTAFKRDPRSGYATGFHGFLQKVSDGKQFLEQIRPDSDKSGAAMRAGPIGVFPSVDEVISRATIQARLTHNTPDGTAAAVASALMAHYFMYQLGPVSSLGEFLDTHVPGERRWSRPYQGKVKSKGWMSVQAAVTAITCNTTLSGLLKTCVEFNGDVDTVAAIALGAASCSPDHEPDLPTHLIEMLENGSYGYAYITALDARLLACINR